MNRKKIIAIVSAGVAGFALLAFLVPIIFGSSSPSTAKSPERNSSNREYAVAMSDPNGGNYAFAAEAADDYYGGWEEDVASESFAGADYSLSYENGSTPNVADQQAGFTELSTSEATPAKLIRTMTMAVETVDFNRVDSDIRARMNQLGGYFEDSTVTGTGNEGDARRGYYVIRIPAGNLDEFVSYFGDACTILSQSESTRDVTLDYVDTQSRISSLRTEMEVLSGMLENAEDLDNLITLQSRITEIRYEIENYESQLRTVDNQVDYSTLTLNVYEVTVESEPEPIKEYTFSEKMSMAYKDGLENLTDNLKETAIAFSYAIPGLLALLAILVVIAVFILIIFFIVRGIVRRKKAKRAKKEPAQNAQNTDDNKKPE